MKLLQKKLSILIIIQLVIIAGLLLVNRSSQQDEAQYLIDNEQNLSLNRWRISDAESSLNLTHDGSKWHLPDAGNLIANASKINNLIDTLEQITMDWPVATSADSFSRLEVADDQHQRHIELFADDQRVADFYLGTSPSFRQVHVRRKGDKAVYTIKVNAFDFPVEADPWLDKSQLKASSIKHIKADDFKLVNDNHSWRLQDAIIVDPKKQLDKTAVQSLASAFAQLRIDAMVDAVDPNQSSIESIEVRLNDGTVLNYSFHQDDENYQIKRSDIDQWFSISESQYQQIAAIQLDDLLGPIEEEAEAGAEAVINTGGKQ